MSIVCAYCAKSLNEGAIEVQVSCSGDLEVGSHYEWYTVGNNGQLLRLVVHTVPLRIFIWISGIFGICITSVKSVCSAGHLFF